MDGVGLFLCPFPYAFNTVHAVAHLVYTLFLQSVGQPSKEISLNFLKFWVLAYSLSFFSLFWQLNICFINHFVCLSILWLFCTLLLMDFVLILFFFRNVVLKVPPNRNNFIFEPSNKILFCRNAKVTNWDLQPRLSRV